MKAMTASLGHLLLGLLILGAVSTVSAQSTWDFHISDAGGGNSLVTWNVTGSLTNPPGISINSYSPFFVVLITAPGIYTDTYTNDGTPQPISILDGSYFTGSGSSAPLDAYYTYSVVGGGDDSFGLFAGINNHGLIPILYNPGTQSVLIPVDFSNFNPGTYHSQESGFSSPLTVNLTVEPVPEPATLALAAVSGLLISRFRKILTAV